MILREITIPDYPDKILISKSRRPVYYVSPSSIRAGKKDIPKTHLKNGKFDSRGILINKVTGLPILANPKLAGKERYWIINFQEVWNGNISKMSRASKVEKLKEILKPHFLNIPSVPQHIYPVRMEIFVFDTDFKVDASNKGAFFTKVIEDLMVTLGIIDGDSPEYVNDTGRIKYVKINEGEQRKMVVRIHSSDNTFN